MGHSHLYFVRYFWDLIKNDIKEKALITHRRGESRISTLSLDSSLSEPDCVVQSLSDDDSFEDMLDVEEPSVAMSACLGLLATMVVSRRGVVATPTLRAAVLLGLAGERYPIELGAALGMKPATLVSSSYCRLRAARKGIGG
jgi:hypothetical protein